ncbi:MAG: phasin family protein [Pseudanabaenaceae cyanobacterium]
MNILQKAFYLGVGLISLVGEKTSSTLDQLRQQASQLAEELVKRGEMTTEEARRFVDEVMDQAKQKPDSKPPTPRPIEILDAPSEDEEIQQLKDRVKELQAELARLKGNQSS